jgi:SAM-dependent methyltransferase
MPDITSIDWNEAWKNHGREGKKRRGFRSCLDRWANPEECRKFDRRVKEDNWKKSRKQLNRMDIFRGSRVLDIGAGPGTLAVPLAPYVEHVTAIEPSSAMLACLKENISTFGIDNITLVQKLWEEVDVKNDLEPPYDVVIASFSLGVSDLKEASLKMDEATNKYVYIFWFADMVPPWQRNYGEIWEKLYGSPYTKTKKPNIVFNLLYQIGILANVEVYTEKSVNRYSSVDEAVADQRYGLNIKSVEQEIILKEFLTKKLRVEGGQYVLRATSPVAKIWWKKERPA